MRLERRTAQGPAIRRPTSGVASRQLDYVFASRELAARLHVRAMNAHEWGPSDHCRVEIHLDE
jgi:endonuclease/exonuclease/phosphatase family metal-dependent hydrolase